MRVLSKQTTRATFRRTLSTATPEEVVNMCKRRGFVFAGSEIYGGLSGSFEYGPLGAQLKKNVRDLWWRDFVERREDCVGFDSSIILSPKVWEATKHVDNFTDPLTECRQCHSRCRVDHLLEKILPESTVAGLCLDGLNNAMVEHNIACPMCGAQDFAPARQFNLLFTTNLGAADDSSSLAYLRPETAQGMLTNYHIVQKTMRLKLPFGIGQTGKAFRNEISPGQFIFRMREFEQCELEFFCQPDEAPEWHAHWVDECRKWLLRYGLKEESIRIHKHEGDELAHYAAASSDIEFHFPHGWGELWGVANRTDFDLRCHAEASGQAMHIEHGPKNEKVYPFVIEPAVGLDRLVYAFLSEAYEIETLPDGKTRSVLRLHPALAPSTFAVLPLQKKPPLMEKAAQVFKALAAVSRVDFDEAGSIGRRYRRQDEAGTPFCVTVDYESLEGGTITIRDRDSMLQERLSMDELLAKAAMLGG